MEPPVEAAVIVIGASHSSKYPELYLAMEHEKRSHREEYWLTLDQFTAGVLGGFTQVLLGQPFDTVKVRLQASGEYKSINECVSRMYRNEGITSFFKGK